MKKSHQARSKKPRRRTLQITIGRVVHPPPCARWPGTSGSWLAGHFLWVLVWTGACYWHGVGGFMFNSSSLFVALWGGALRFRVVAVFRVIPEHPTGLADDDATTTTRNTKPASYAPARPVPRVRLVYDGHGGAVILAVGRVAFVSCATPRGAGTNLNDSDAAAWWFVCLYL